jgi:hypothetical protein
LFNSSIDTYGYLYNNSFNSSFPNQNLLTQDGEDDGDNRYDFIYFLESSVLYVAVATTYSSSVTGAFSIITTGPASVGFSQLNITSKHSSYSQLLFRLNRTNIAVFSHHYII